MVGLWISAKPRLTRTVKNINNFYLSFWSDSFLPGESHLQQNHYLWWVSQSSCMAHQRFKFFNPLPLFRVLYSILIAKTNWLLQTYYPESEASSLLLLTSNQI